MKSSKPICKDGEKMGDICKLCLSEKECAKLYKDADKLLFKSFKKELSKSGEVTIMVEEF